MISAEGDVFQGEEVIIAVAVGFPFFLLHKNVISFLFIASFWHLT
jgi:hypothetical protein